MPKIIENLKDRLLQEAQRQMDQSGYGALTIRGIAKGCGVGVGTVYNYFPSKDALVATLLLEDWTGCIRAIEGVAAAGEDPEPDCRCIYEQLRAFAGRHEKLFRDEAAAPAFSGSFGRYHGVLREQLARPLRKFCRGDFDACFAAESLLVWTMAGTDFAEIYAILKKLF